MATGYAPTARWRNDRIFYTGMGVPIALTTFAGFARSYYLGPWFETPKGTPEVGALLHLHGAVFTAWIALNVVQPALIANRNPGLHRRIGVFGAGIAAAMVILGNVAAVAAMHGGFIGMGDPHAFYAIPFFAINTFAVIVALAIFWRNRAETHKRLMLLSATQIVEAAVARIPLDTIVAGAPYSFMIVPDLIIVAGAGYDWFSRGKVHKVWIVGGGLVIASQMLRLWISQTEPWLAFARTMAGMWPS